MLVWWWWVTVANISLKWYSASDTAENLINIHTSSASYPIPLILHNPHPFTTPLAFKEPRASSVLCCLPAKQWDINVCYVVSVSHSGSFTSRSSWRSGHGEGGWGGEPAVRGLREPAATSDLVQTRWRHFCFLSQILSSGELSHTHTGHY